MPKIEKSPNSSIAFIGIDPGMKGGLVMIHGDIIEAIPMPATERDIWNWFNLLPHRRVAVIESVHSMPSQSAQSGFTFGRGYGFLRACLIASGTKFDECSTMAWLKALSIPSGKQKDIGKSAWKEILRGKAQQLFPDLPIWKQKNSKGKQLAVSDALLIAEHCRRKFGG